MQSHYVCSECGYLSKLSGTCQDDNCISQGIRLSECHCEDGEHGSLKHVQAEDGEDPLEQEKEASKNGYSVNTLDLDEKSPGEEK